MGKENPVRGDVLAAVERRTCMSVHDRSGIQEPSRLTGDAVELAAGLRRRIRGEVRFDAGARALYATDGSNYRQVPIGVVVPKDVDDVIETVAACRDAGAPVLARGGGTSLAGQCCNVAVVLDMSKYLNRVLEIDPERKIGRVEPGTVLDDLRDAAKPHGLTFGPDPSTHNHCTLGGMIGNNSCGVRSVLAEFHGPGPRTSDNVAELEVLTYDGLRLRVGPTSEPELERLIREGGRRGEIYAGLKSVRDRYADLIRARYPRIPRRVSGYNLDELLPERGFNLARALAGTEGTCVVTLEARVHLIDWPPARVLLVLGYPDVFSAADHIPEIMACQPVGCEGLDDRLLGYMKKKGLHPEDGEILPEGGGWLLVEFGGGSRDEAVSLARRLMAQLNGAANAPTMKLFDNPEDQHTVWRIRESGLGATAFVPGLPDTWPGWEDSAVPPDRLGDYLRALRSLMQRYDYQPALYGHFGQGCVHTRIEFDLQTTEGIATYRAFMEEAADLVIGFGGSLSGEHGDGQARAELLPKMFGPELVEAFREFKTVWDPAGRMNPGKVVDPYRLDEHLRLGAGSRRPGPPTHFQFPDDDSSFARATLRCVGVGECRRAEGGTMCPSYRVTRDEQHATRGRARLLFEMLQGDVITEGWKSEAVKEAFDLCLACKGCKSDCPVNVDMATYKAEFLSHYYEGRLRPRHAFAFGLIHWWARVGAPVAGLANVFTQTPGLRRLAKRAAGMAPARAIPPFARQTFRGWLRHRGRPSTGRPRVLLWPDTFNNYFFPQTLAAGVEVLEDAGFDVAIPSATLCCGRPLYDYGMLDLAKRQLRQILDALRPEIAAGTPVVGLEPSCVAVFRDELVNLFPGDADAKRLSRQTLTLAEFLTTKAAGYRPPVLRGKVLLHGHCHQKAIMRLGPDQALLAGMGLDVETPDSGCCGMAGSFGFEADHYDISIKVGERVLLPAVRAAATETLVVADGFSCREQILQTTDRRALHLAEVLHLARRAGERLPAGERPEAAYARIVPFELGAARLSIGSVLAMGAVAASALWALRREANES